MAHKTQSTRIGRMRRIARNTMLLAGVFMLQGADGEFFGCSTGGDHSPHIETISPKAGLPGVEVTITGEGLHDPLTDESVVLHFDGIRIVARNLEEVIESEGVITFWGPHPETGVDTIRFKTPVREPVNRQVDVYVETSNGESNIVEFFDGDPENPCAVDPDPELCTPAFTDFVGAIILEDTEEVVLFRMEKQLNNDAVTDPVLVPVPWDDENDVDILRNSFAREAYNNTAFDVRVDGFGNGALLLSQLPQTDPVDGVQGMVVFSEQYSEAATAHEGLLRPSRLASTGLGNGDADERLLAVVGESSAQIDVHSGDLWNTREQYNLVDLGPAVRPKAAVFNTTGEVLVTGTDALTDTAWIAAINRDDGTLSKLLDLNGVVPVDIVRYAWESTDNSFEDIYVAYNTTGDDPAAGLVRYRIPASGETQVSELMFETGTQVGAMVLDEASAFGHIDPENNKRIHQLWLSLDDSSEANDDMVLSLRLQDDLFPQETSTYAAWKDYVADMAAQAVSDYNAEVSYVSQNYEGTTTAAAIDAITVPVMPLMEFRSLNPDSESAIIDGPFSLSVVPTAASEQGPTFLLISNRDAGASAGLAVIRTDGAWANADNRGVAPELGSLEGFVWVAIELPGETPGRLYCLQAGN